MVPEIWSMTDIIFCCFGPFFAFYSPNNPENQNFVKMNKNPGDLIILHKCTKNHDHIVPETWHMTDVIFIFHFELSLPFYPLTAQKIKIKKKSKNAWRYHHFTRVPKIMITWCMVPEIWCTMDQWQDRQTDRWKKWHMDEGAPPKNWI